MLTGWEGGRLRVNWVEIDVIQDGGGIFAYRVRTYKAPKVRWVLDHVVDSRNTETGINADDQEEEEHAPFVNIKGGLKLWCERFCLDPSPVKSYFPSLT